MYSGEYDACDVTLSVYPHRASLKNMPDHGGNRTYDLWNTSPMLCQLSYAVWSVRVCDISKQNLVPLISMLSNNNHNIDIEGTRFCIRQIRRMMTGRLETSVLKGFTRRNLQIC